MGENRKKYYSVGRVKDAHGLRGELFIKLRSKRADWLDQLDQLLLSKDENSQETSRFPILCAKPFKEGLIIKAEGINDRTAAEKLKGFFMLIPTSLLMTSDENDFYYYEIQNFEVLDKTLKFIGCICGFGSNGAQDLIIVEGPFGKIDIPFIDEFIEKVSFEEKRVYMNLPEGLVNINEV